jgi:hypothetical protein
VFAEAGNYRSIIDEINPETGRSRVYGQTLEEIRQRYPTATTIAWRDWLAEKARGQQTPIAWQPTTREQYHRMLEILPPVAWQADGFMVGEPYDHCAETGRARFTAYRVRGSGDYRRYEVASRPLTVAEFRAELRRNGGAA